MRVAATAAVARMGEGANVAIVHARSLPHDSGTKTRKRCGGENCRSRKKKLDRGRARRRRHPPPHIAAKLATRALSARLLDYTLPASTPLSPPNNDDMSYLYAGAAAVGLALAWAAVRAARPGASPTREPEDDPSPPPAASDATPHIEDIGTPTPGTRAPEAAPGGTPPPPRSPTDGGGHDVTPRRSALAGTRDESSSSTGKLPASRNVSFAEAEDVDPVPPATPFAPRTPDDEGAGRGPPAVATTTPPSPPLRPRTIDEDDADDDALMGSSSDTDSWTDEAASPPRRGAGTGGGDLNASASHAALPSLVALRSGRTTTGGTSRGMGRARRVSRSFSEPNLSGVAELEARAADEAAAAAEAAAHGAGKGEAADDAAAVAPSSAPPAPPLCLRLDVLAGPAAGLSVHTPPGAAEVTIGRAPSNALVLPDGEVSGTHAILRWDARARAWTVTDAGSLNGTRVDSAAVGAGGRRRGRTARLTSDAILCLGRQSQLRVVYLPADVAAADAAAAALARAAAAMPTPTGLVGPPAPLRLRSLGPPPGLRPLATVDAEAGVMGAPNDDAATRAALTPTRAAAEVPTLGIAMASVTQLGVEHARRDMACEDAVRLVCDLSVEGGVVTALPSPTTLLVVCDGHGGGRAADDAAEYLPGALAARASADAAGLASDGAWAMAFADADARAPPDRGTTATLVALWRDAVHSGLLLRAANVGDSAAVLIVEGGGDAAPPSTPPQLGAAADTARPTINAPLPPPPTALPPRTIPYASQVTPPATPGTPPPPPSPGAPPPSPPSPVSPPTPSDASGGATLARLTADHRLSAPAERARLAAAGVPLPAGSAPRLYGLNLSRCLGDTAIKAGDLGLTGDPHVSPVTWLPPGSRALLLAASDGVWDVASARRAAAAARTAAAAAAGKGRQAAAAAAADAVAALASRRHSRDDVSVVVAIIDA